MACYAIVKLPTGIQATQDEVADALVYMGIKVSARNNLYIYSDRVNLTRENDKAPWEVSQGSIDLDKFKQATARSKALAIAKSQGYGAVREEKLPDGRIVIRARD